MYPTLLKRLPAAWKAAGADNIGLLAAGVSYYAFLALVPLLAAGMLGYGLIADPETVAEHIAALSRRLPQSAAELIGDQLQGMVETSGNKKGLGLTAALALALFGARNGAASLVTAINIAHRRSGERPFWRAALLALAITAAAIAGAGLVVLALSLTAGLQAMLPGLGSTGAFLGRAAGYAVLLAAGTGGAMALYRVAPHGPNPPWRDVLPGAVIAGIFCMVLTLGFGIYVANFGSYNATYGSLGAIVVLLTWIYLVAYALLFGAEINAPDRQ